jgi:PAS domain-containing protein
MSDRIPEPTPAEDLRSRAASRLTGAAGAQRPSFRTADALSVLHTLASSPATAADALAMLHELQVHQVELDLQAEELRDSRAELESALRRQIELYDHLPVASFTVDRHLALCDMNHAGERLLGVARDDAQGLPLDSFMAPASAQLLRSSIADSGNGAAPLSPLLDLIPRHGPAALVRAHLGADPTGQRVLLVLMPVVEVQGRPTGA